MDAEKIVMNAEKIVNNFWPIAFFTGEREVENGDLYAFFTDQGDRYPVDRAGHKRWYRIDSEQDSYFFGQWCNPATLQALSYLEGDIYLVQCRDRAAYLREIQEAGTLNDHDGLHDAKLQPGGINNQA